MRRLRRSRAIAQCRLPEVTVICSRRSRKVDLAPKAAQGGWLRGGHKNHPACLTDLFTFLHNISTFFHHFPSPSHHHPHPHLSFSAKMDPPDLSGELTKSPYGIVAVPRRPTLSQRLFECSTDDAEEDNDDDMASMASGISSATTTSSLVGEDDTEELLQERADFLRDMERDVRHKGSLSRATHLLHAGDLSCLLQGISGRSLP